MILMVSVKPVETILLEYFIRDSCKIVSIKKQEESHIAMEKGQKTCMHIIYSMIALTMVFCKTCLKGN